LTLGEASRLLGVDETTLRGWANSGKIRVFRTPGGHRRFNVSDLTALMGTVPPAPGRLKEIRAQQSREWMVSRPWFSRIPDDAIDRVRTQCGHLMRILAASVGGEAGGTQFITDARSVGTELGREVARWGLTPAQSTEVFLHFKSAVMDVLAVPSTGAPDQIRLLRNADAFLGEVFQAMMNGYEERPAAEKA
jgi:excisionase family DNA binding protein